MPLNSADLPQADVLDDVMRVLNAVAAGATSYQAIAQHLGKVDRQGRYYRLAAQLLGLVSNQANHAELTQAGQQLLAASPEDRERLLKEAVLTTRFFQQILPFVEQRPFHRDELEDHLRRQVSDIGPTIIGRRTSTILAWLTRTGLVEQDNNLYTLSKKGVSTVSVIRYRDARQPMLPRAMPLPEFEDLQERVLAEPRVIQVLRHEIRRERADNAHVRLVNMVADAVRRAGAVPRSNPLVDLATWFDERAFLFEMKSLTPSNARHQMRRGISQLYEYRYLQSLPQSVLVLVIEDRLPPELRWMEDYLEEDRGIYLIWEGQGQLQASDRARTALAFLWGGQQV